MFTYLKLKNFKSLKDVTLNLRETQEKTKNFVAIYGENGCGKTNLITAFDLLPKMIISKLSDNVRSKEFYEALETLERKDMFINLLDSFVNFKNYRMIDEKEPTEIEYGFLINGVEGNYYIKFSEKIEDERLYFKLDKQRGFLFEIKNQEDKIIKKLNNIVFNGKKYATELEEEIDKYWGKHTFLAILYEEMLNKNFSFIRENISDNLLAVIGLFISVNTKIDRRIGNAYLDLNLFEKSENDIAEDTIKESDITLLNKYEKVLKLFFTQAYSDIKDVYYVKEKVDDKIKYKLYFKKMIAGKVRNICYKDESNGTVRILKQFNSIIATLNGKTVIIDEIDNGIHDVLIKNIIMSLKDEITGQLIITTHNTLLLEFLPKKEVYVITVDYEGNKKVCCITEFKGTIQKNNNARDMYFKGAFGGIPFSDYIDFEEIKSYLKSTNSEEG